jgi:hypothetical protein
MLKKRANKDMGKEFEEKEGKQVYVCGISVKII